MVCGRCGVPALPGAAAVGRRVHLSVLRDCRWRLVADGRRAASLRGLPVGDLGDGGHDLRRHADAVGELVRSDLVRGQPEAGRLRAGAAARARAGQLSRPRGRGCTNCVARWCSPAASCSRAPSRSTRATSAPAGRGQAVVARPARRSWQSRSRATKRPSVCA